MKKLILFGASLALIVPAAASAGDAAAGKAKYDMFCSSCHGASGKGDGPAGAALNPKARDFTDAAWQDATDDATIHKAIKEGGAAIGKSPLMPPWGASLSDADIDNVVAYIRSLKGK